MSLQVPCTRCHNERSPHPQVREKAEGRPLAIQKDSTWYSYGLDLTKNVCELFTADATLATTYRYTPYGAVTVEGNAEQPIQWSSEFYDTELALVYYNYRHYNPLDGRWTVRDTIEDKEQMQTYSYTANSPVPLSDYLGQEVKFESRPCMAEMRVAYLDYQMYKDDPEGYSPEDVYQMCGGQVAADRKANPKLYENSCALRICMALNASGYRIKGQGERYKKGKSNTLNLLGVEELRQYIYKQWGKPDIRIINSETADFKDWSGRVTGRCGIVFYLDNKTWNAGHVGLIIDGRPYKDPYGDTTGKVDLWFVPCNCKEKKVSSPCACCLENL